MNPWLIAGLVVLAIFVVAAIFYVVVRVSDRLAERYHRDWIASVIPLGVVALFIFLIVGAALSLPEGVA